MKREITRLEGEVEQLLTRAKASGSPGFTLQLAAGE